MSRQRLAVVGGGAAGIAAAFYLQSRFDVTLLEAAPRIGGHAYPVRIEEQGAAFYADTAFLIFNSHSYPKFLGLLRDLALEKSVIDTDMSIGIHHRQENLTFAVNAGINALIPQMRHALRPQFPRFLLELAQFRRAADPNSLSESGAELSLESYLEKRGFSRHFAETFAYPLGASVWSLPQEGVRNLPASLYFSFFNNHKLLKKEQGARWQTLSGSSHLYHEAFRSRFKGVVRLSANVEQVRREERGATLRVNGQTEIFDRVVVATHADTALKLLASPSELEAQTLGAWAYRACELFLHTDQELFPKVRGSWPSWNVECDSSAAESPFTVTYNLNRIQKIPAKKQYFVSWGNRAPCAEHVLERFRFRHPSFTLATEKAKESLPRLSSQSLAFCGSYFGNGFHEDAVASAITVSEFLC